ncbi:MAG: dicarboxylate/amino acid:cation symporter [Acidobacteria bacterium]|nr:dicarboxylate/amino acid:cation symporter [Acidobacteriota bacterium]
MRKPLYTVLYVQVLVAIVVGVVLGYVAPETGAAMRPLGDGFIKLVRMMIAPIIFCVVVVGIAKIGDLRAVGRIGVKALVYFEVISTIALIVGLIVVNTIKPGVGINADPASLDTSAVANYASSAAKLSTVDFLLNIIPNTVVGAFSSGEILQVLFFSVLFGLGLLHLGAEGRHLVSVIDQFSHGLFRVIGIIMRAAPVGAFGAMAFTIGRYGIGTLLQLGQLMAGVYLTCLLFIFIVLGTVCRLAGFSVWKFLKFIKEELLITVGTSSSEAVLPRMMDKLEHLGCAKPVVGLVIPTGYSFNLDGTSIYMTMAAIFIAQATNSPLSFGQQIGLLGLAVLTSKGSAAITGGGFVTLAATLAAFPAVPVAGLALIIGIDRFMSEARALTNLIGNGIATIVVAKWEGALDTERMHRVLNGETVDAIETRTTVAPAVVS